MYMNLNVFIFLKYYWQWKCALWLVFFSPWAFAHWERELNKNVPSQQKILFINPRWLDNCCLKPYPSLLIILQCNGVCRYHIVLYLLMFVSFCYQLCFCCSCRLEITKRNHIISMPTRVKKTSVAGSVVYRVQRQKGSRILWHITLPMGCALKPLKISRQVKNWWPCLIH